MSNTLAIATVTETLRQMLADYVVNLVNGAAVTVLAPNANSTFLPNPGVNIFLYQVSPNAALRNADLPTRTANGKLLRRPQTALDLHYLLTFYGDSQLTQQRLLGAVVLALHANPELPVSLIQHVEATTPMLAGSGLAQQPEPVRVVPVNFTLEELSKLWSFLLKIDYVLSTAYRASVVLIETDDVLPPPAPPVLAFNFRALPFRQPVITQVLPAPGTGPLILPGSQITLIGLDLVAVPGGGGTEVEFGHITLPPGFVSPTRIVVSVPAGLAAGPQTVRVLHKLLLGTPPVPHPAGIRSDVATFVLHPVIRPGAGPGSFAIVGQRQHGSPPEDVIIVTIDPTVRAGQSAALQLIGLGQPAATHLFSADPIETDSDSVVFPVPGLPSGTYLARALIDGAGSPFELDPSGAPIAPTVSW